MKTTAANAAEAKVAAAAAAAAAAAEEITIAKPQITMTTVILRSKGHPKSSEASQWLD